MRKNCNFVLYGDEEKRCTYCGFITWVNNSKTDSEIINDMFTGGISPPKCFVEEDFDLLDHCS